MPRVFISATSHDLKSYRQIVVDWAQSRNYAYVVQEEFPVVPDYQTVVQMLRGRLDPCDAVIHLAGLYYGSEPTNRPADAMRRSYTQLEYELGQTLQRQVIRLIAQDYTPDHNLAAQPAELAQLQLQHRQRLMSGDQPYYTFCDHTTLRARLEQIEIKTTITKPRTSDFTTLGSLFKGRDGAGEAMEQLRTALTQRPSHIAAVTGKHAIHGLGGIGKTRLAIEYGYRHQHEYNALLFVSADSPERFRSSLAQLAGALVLNLPEQSARELDVQLAAVLRWLREHSGWYLVIDNVDTPEAQAEVTRHLELLSAGHVVVTSRLAHWSQLVEPLALDVLSATAGTEFLLERTAGQRRSVPSDAEDARTLAGQLDGLSLALEQAGAFIVRHRCSFAEYSQRWRAQEAKVLGWFDPVAMQYPRSVAVTWQTSLDLLADDGRGLLNVLCWLAPDPIPRTMIEKLKAEAGEQAIDVETGLADLTAYSLAKWGENSASIVVHRLVEEITRYRLNEVEKGPWLKRALRMVDDFIPAEPNCYDVRSWPAIFHPGQNHIAAVTQHADELQISSTTTRLMSVLAGYLETRGSFTEAERLMRRALDIEEEAMGADHPTVALRLNNLAQLLKATNRLAEAEQLMRRALAIDERSFGAKHFNVARHLNNLAQLLHDKYHLADAEPLMRRALAIDEAFFGAEHPTVAIDLNNLALLLKDSNHFAEAEQLIHRALDIDERAFGTEHPNFARHLNNLATLLLTANRLTEAEPLIRRALAIDEASFGTSHPTVAIDLNNLAIVLQETNRPADAEPLMRRALEIDEASFGPEHPTVAIDLNNLARLLQDTKRPAEAEPLMGRAMAIVFRSLGPNHPSTRTVRGNYLFLLQEMGLAEEEVQAKIRAHTLNEQEA